MAAASLLLASCYGQQTPAAAAVPQPAPVLRVMTFNIYRGLADGGERRWRYRRELVVETIAQKSPHLLGLQEALPQQQRDLQEALAHHRLAGLSAEGSRLGEVSPMLVDRRRLDIEREGMLWLNESGKPLVKGWDAAFPRTCAWAVLRDRETGTRLVALNTHFDNKGEQARAESARLVARRLPDFAGLPALLLGDLNAEEHEPPLESLKATGLRDTFRVLFPAAQDVRTSHRFQGLHAGSHKIDYVLGSGEWIVRDAGILRFARDGRYPSDHFPVWAELTLEARAPAAADPGVPRR